MKDNNNIFNIEANYHFFESFFLWLEEKFSGELQAAQIFLPNRRSCRELKELFLKKNITGALPQIKAISDISFEDFFQFLPSDSAKAIIDEISIIKVLDDVDYLFFLSEKIRQREVFGKLNFEQSFKTAVSLKGLFDEIEREEADIATLINLAAHRQITLEFLNDFSIHVKNSLIKENILSISSYQNFIVKRFIQCLQDHQLKSPIIIAGSTGSIVSSRKLIKAISAQEKGFVILHDFKKQKSPKENHPQFLLDQLTKFIDCNSVVKITHDNFKISSNIRQNLIALMMLPFEESIKWQNIVAEIDVKKAAQDLEENFTLIEANSDIVEAKLIALTLQKNSQKKSAVIVNNGDFANLLKLELERLGLEFNDSRSLDIFNSKLINFLILILELIESDFNSHILLSLFKHPLCKIDDAAIIQDFEINILRKERSESGLNGLKNTLKNNQVLQEFFNGFLAKIKFESDINSLIKNVENLTHKTWSELLNQQEAQEEIFYLFEKLKKQNYTPNSASDFKTILSQISYFGKSNSHAKIQILSPIEARLLNFDFIVISSLNEGLFPQIESENWLGKKIKKDLGVEKSLQKIGQNAHDFCNYLSNKSVVLSYCKSRNGAALIESPFLLKFKTIAKKLDAKINNGDEFFKRLAAENNIPQLEISVANPKPAKDLRPQRFSITEISKLISNPYFIYCKKILQLKELDKIDYEAGYAEFGSFIHKALEEFIKNPKTDNFAEIFAEYFTAKEAHLIWWPKFQRIFSDFLDKNSQFQDSKNQVEEAVETRIGNILIRGKIDRMIFNEANEVEIFDYKTGTIAEKKDVISGLEPQLTIAALILLEKQLQISSLNYWKLSPTSEGEIKKISKDKEEVEILIAAAESGLKKLFSYFESEENGYLATDNLSYDEYQHLARLND